MTPAVTGEALALASAFCFGTTHFVSGLLARTRHGATIALYAQTAGLAGSVPLAAAASGGAAGLGPLAWGALSGLGTGAGVGFLYWSMNATPISVAVPVSDVTAVALPVLVEIAVAGERPSATAVAGLAVGVPAIWLVSRDGDARRRGASDARPHGGRSPGTGRRGTLLALLAGVGFAAQFLAMARIPEDGGWWPVTMSRAVSVVALLLLVGAVGAPPRLPARPAAGAAGAGLLGTAAIILYLLATRHQLVTVAVLLTALYPAIPVLLALLLLHERCTWTQAVGLLCAGGAIALTALG